MEFEWNTTCSLLCSLIGEINPLSQLKVAENLQVSLKFSIYEVIILFGN